jgi:hypothetical protein
LAASLRRLPREASAQPAPIIKSRAYNGSMMDTLPTPKGWFENGNTSWVP